MERTGSNSGIVGIQTFLLPLRPTSKERLCRHEKTLPNLFLSKVELIADGSMIKDMENPTVPGVGLGMLKHMSSTELAFFKIAVSCGERETF